MENESQLQTAEEYAFSVMELEKDGKFAVWEGDASTDPISTLKLNHAKARADCQEIL